VDFLYYIDIQSVYTNIRIHIFHRINIKKNTEICKKFQEINKNISIMENIVVLNEQQFEDIIYRTVSRCLAEKNIGNFEDSPVEEGYYDRSEVCGELHISYPTLWRIEKSGLLRSQKVGRKNLYSKQEVNDLIKSGKLAEYKPSKK
jgi:hypothetical protein